jgi:hypothetical protein
MATEEQRLDAGNEGSSASEAATANAGATEAPTVTAPDYSNLPPELRPDADGNPPVLTEALMRKLRGEYFTVKHARLDNCEHRIDLITEPRTNCQNCWWNWFNIHPQLIETTDQFFRTKGKEPLIAMRGKRYFKMFLRFMSTVCQLQKEQEALNAKQIREANPPSVEDERNMEDMWR